MEASGRAATRSHRVSVVLPALNEEEGLARTLDELPLDDLYLAGLRPQVLVVDGGSTDGTVRVAQRRGATVLHQTGSGKGDAVRLGLTTAIAEESEFVAVIDADYSYSADSLLPAFSLLAAGTDLVIGARRPVYDPRERLRALAHRVGDALLSLTAARLSHVPFVDICSGLWGVRTDAVRQVDLESDGFEIESELFLKMARKGFRVSQVPVTYRPRIGTAKLRAIKDGSRILLTILRFSRTRLVGGTSVTFQYLPERSPPPDLRPSQDWLRMVQALCFSVSPPRLSIIADPGRAEEAKELAHRLWAGKIRVDLTVSSLVPRRTSRIEDGMADPTPVVHLPALADAPSVPPMAIVQVPRSGALLYVPTLNGPATETSTLERSGGYRLLRSPDSPASVLTNLVATLHGTSQERSDALLYATAGNLGLRSSPPSRAQALPDLVPNRNPGPPTVLNQG